LGEGALMGHQSVTAHIVEPSSVALQFRGKAFAER